MCLLVDLYKTESGSFKHLNWQLGNEKTVYSGANKNLLLHSAHTTTPSFASLNCRLKLTTQSKNCPKILYHLLNTKRRLQGLGVGAVTVRR